ncbi:hypothetical protein [Caulobacter mirabilis]|uniref:Uncharacterized protein n=1 Tax=Caulobacter mirabilis TaxID=69666 RepID=A0A2D2AVS2_9CAUL|nr:hypothetical protein [Caulobacter mirabilis]ATQ42071.1 hypothetical protein CSW64_06390 [Caulobacter mirabilis]
MSEPSPPPSRGLSPAGWTAISAIAVALIGAVVTLGPGLMSRDKPAPGDAPSAPKAAEEKAAPAADDPAVLAGRWTGLARAAGGESFPIEIEVTAGCTLNGPCGAIRVPRIPCNGRLTLIAAGAQGFEFRVDDFDAASDPAVCKPGGGEVLRPGPNGTLRYTATYSNATGLLNRAE